MSSSSSFTSRNYSYDVFASFHGPDVRKTFLSHVREQFNRNGITMFDDQEIARSATIGPSLVKAIRESRISIVILSKKYASSSWCLDELVEILECKRDMGQIVMTIFYGVEPSDVRKQNGEFGIAFRETCASKTEEEKQKWEKALQDVGEIAGEDFLKCDNEAKLIKKMARDVSDKLNATPPSDFDDIVGLEGHLSAMESLLDFDCDVVKMVAITGPAGIGKTTIARALQSRFATRFQLTGFVDNLRGSYQSGLDESRLQERLLSNMLNQDGIRIRHSGVIKERLCKQRALLILDDVINIRQLQALANETTWFGPGSRVVVTTENEKLMQQHGIENFYHVGFPSMEQALEILCKYAFGSNSPTTMFKNLAETVTMHCSRLPLGLRVVGSSLRGENEEGWEDVIRKLETNLDRDIEDVLRVVYESLEEDEKALFLHIVVFFNYKDCYVVKAMFADSDLDVKNGLNILVNKSLIEISAYGETIVMHRLIRQVGIKAIHRQKPWERRILIDADEICDVLEKETGSRKVFGISFDISGINVVSVSKGAFKKMPNLQFLSVEKRRYDGNDIMIIPEDMDFPQRLRLLHWNAYPGKTLPSTFCPEYLVELNMRYSKLEKLWGGTQPLANLKKVDLYGSSHLKEVPDFSDATNLEKLDLNHCKSLVELPSSVSNLPKLERLEMQCCTKLEIIPTNWNVPSLRLVTITETNIATFDMSATTVEELHHSITIWPQRQLHLSGNGKLKTLTQLPTNITLLDLSNSAIERISDCCINRLPILRELRLCDCIKLTSLPELPPSLGILSANDCEALETIVCPWNTPKVELSFINCLRLDQQARRAIIQQHLYGYWSSCLPGSQLPEEFMNRQGMGNKLTFLLPAFCYFKVCLVISLELSGYEQLEVLGLRIRKGYRYYIQQISCCNLAFKSQRKHLFIFHSSHLLHEERCFGMSKEIEFEFRSNFEIVQCGAQILTYESESGGSGNENVGNNHGVTHESDEEGESESIVASEGNLYIPFCAYKSMRWEEYEPCRVVARHIHVTSWSCGDENYKNEIHTGCWSWLILCSDLSNIVRKIGSLIPRRRLEATSDSEPIVEFM